MNRLRDLVTYPIRRGPVVEAAVMGRSAVAVCVLFWQIPALAFFTGYASSTTIDDVSSSKIIPLLWSACFLLSGFFMGAVYLLRRETDKAWAEIAVLLLFVVAMSVYLAAFLDRSQTLDGRLAILALMGSMIVNLVGRMVLLGRQLWRVRQIKQEQA